MGDDLTLHPMYQTPHGPDADARLPAALDTLTDLCEAMLERATRLEETARKERELEHYVRQLVESLDPSGTLRKG